MNLEVGAELPELVKHPTTRQLVQYAGLLSFETLGNCKVLAPRLLFGKRRRTGSEDRADR